MTRVLIIDDHEVVREGLKRILAEEHRGTIFGEAGSPTEALAAARQQEWDVAVLDLSLGEYNGLDLLKELRRLQPRMPVLVLSMHAEEQYARRAYKAGASGYVTKDAPRSQLVFAFNKVARGGRYVSPELAERLVENYDPESDRTRYEALSDREFEVMRLIASGKTVTEIAALLSLSDSTISTYRARILDKLDMRTNAEVTRYAIQNKLVD
jgi:DNA-binding NarL/FixJ family response regulator